MAKDNKDKRKLTYSTSELNKIEKYYLGLKREESKHKAFSGVFSLDARDLEVLEGIEYGGDDARRAADLEEGRKLLLEQIGVEKRQLKDAKSKLKASEKSSKEEALKLVEEAREILERVLEARQKIICQQDEILTNVILSLEVD